MIRIPSTSSGARPDGRPSRSPVAGAGAARATAGVSAPAGRRSTVRPLTRPRRARLVQGLADLGPGRARARRRLGRARPDDAILLCPLADGGEGTLEAIAAAGGWAWREAAVNDPLGRPVRARWLRSDDGDARRRRDGRGLRAVAGRAGGA